jgi:trehalose-phosphatase
VSPGRLLVVTDFDGTLAEIVPDPAAAKPRADSLDAVGRLVAAVQRVAVISGRTTEALRQLLPVPGLELFGDYGLVDPDAAERGQLEAFNRAAARLLRQYPAAVMEPKAGSTSVHYRADPALAEPLLEALAPLAERMRLRAGRGRMVIEVRPVRADKGTTLTLLLQRERPLGLVVAGDDEGDRPAFEVAAGQAIPHVVLGVRSLEAAPEIFDACDLVVDGPASAAAFFQELAGWAESTGIADPRSNSSRDL